ncbi:MAG: lysophospholipid acyltransferase family protein [bacterium]
MGQRRKKSQLLFKAEYYVVLCIMKCMSITPRSFILSMGKVLGIIVYFIDRKHRLLIINNLKRVFQDKREDWYRSIARQNFCNFGMLSLEFSHISRLTKDTIKDILTFDGKEYIESALSQGKGVILLSAHTGNWELAAAGMSLLDLPFNAVVKRIKNPYVNHIITSQREYAGMKTILHGDGVKKIVKALKNNEIVCFLVDQASSKKNGIPVSFFGYPAWTHIGIIVLALKYNPPIIPAFALREGIKHRLVFQKPFELIRTDTLKKDIEVNTLRMNKLIEGVVREYPSQWFWMHNRWKRRI